MTKTTQVNITIPTEELNNASEELIWEILKTSIEELDFRDGLIDSKTGLLTQRGEVRVALGIRLLMLSSWKISDTHGFHDNLRPFSEEIALGHSELSEALECWREDQPQLWYKDEDSKVTPESKNEDGTPRKPEGAASEYADVLIRVGDSSECQMFNLIWALVTKLRFNVTRPHLHGGKKA